MPSVTTKGGILMYAIRIPLTYPTNSAAIMASRDDTQTECPQDMKVPTTIAARQTVDPTDRSIPPEIITAVIPWAIMPTNAKLRVTLKRFCWVAKVSVSSESAKQANTAATKTQ